MKDFAPRIKKIRLFRDYTQAYLAYKLGITISAYSKIERGKTDPSLSRMLQISEILEFKLGDFSQVDETKPESLIVSEDQHYELYGFVTRKEFDESLRMIADLRMKIVEILNKISH